MQFMKKIKTLFQVYIVLVFCLTTDPLFAVAAHASQLITEPYEGRTALVYLPTTLPANGSRALVVVLHGGLGNAQRISGKQSESALNMDALAEQAGFVVAYLNGTPVARLLGSDKLGWNAGKCCGLPAEKKIDDVAYLQATVKAIAAKYGIDQSRIYGVGHSNGAMMTQRMMCETSSYSAAVAISGALENEASNCPLARGKRLMAIHGEDDQNVPINGGKGSKGISRTNYASQAATAEVWQGSGASYELKIIKAANHSTENINMRLIETESTTLAQKIALFFGLIPGITGVRSN
jgi:poly(3-hydroxybutyrate) depolymerase